MPRKMNIRAKFLPLAFATLLLASCGGGEESPAQDPESYANSEQPAATTEPAATGAPTNKGVGPITSIALAETIDEAMAKKGEELFTAKCTACHKIEARYVGPGLAGVTAKRTPEWIMNMIMVPEKMTAEDPDAKALLAEYIAPMANQSVTEEEARALLEYLRTQN